jgi:hypothetical protein
MQGTIGATADFSGDLFQAVRHPFLSLLVLMVGSYCHDYMPFL